MKWRNRMSYIYTNKKGEGIGVLEGGVFKKKVSKKKHFMRKLNSWGMDKRVLDDLGDEIVIEIFDRDEKKTYTVTAKEFKGGEIHDYGFGEQVFLKIDKFGGKDVHK
jgi:hypothetical protein